MFNPFNLFKRQSAKTALVAPLFDEAFLRRLERINFRTVPALRGGMGGERRSRNLRPALDFSDHRPYAAGDDLRHVDWNAYARHEELFVKLGEATQSVNLHLLLDASPSMAWTPAWPAADGTPPGGKWPAARRLAGAMGYLGLSGGERLTITPFAGQLEPGFGPTHGKRRAVAALNFLAALTPGLPTPAEPGRNLAACLTTYAHTHPAGGLLVLISDLLDTAPAGETDSADVEWLAQGLAPLTPPRWQVIVLHLLSQEEVSPALSGDYNLQDVETGHSLPFQLDAHTLSRYRLRVRRWGSALQRVCAHRGATYAQVMVEWPFEKAIIPYLRRRGVVQ